MKLNITDIQEIKNAQSVSKQIRIMNNSQEVENADLLISMFKFDLDSTTDQGLHPVVGSTYAEFGDWNVYENGSFEKLFDYDQTLADQVSIIQSDSEDKTDVNSYEFDSAHTYVLETTLDLIGHLDSSYAILITYGSGIYYNNNVVVRQNAETGLCEATIFYLDKDSQQQ